MNDEKGQNADLTSNADAAFRQAARKAIQIARQTGTPIIVWEEGRVKEIPADRAEATRLHTPLTAHRTKTAPCP